MTALKQIDPIRSVSFSGHRPDRLPGQGEPDAPEAQKLIKVLRGQIEDAILRGKDTFINGLMAGWDVLAAEQVIALKERCPHIRLVTVAPFSSGLFSRERCWTPDWVERAKGACRQSDIGMSLSECYRAGIYYERDRVMVDHSGELLCYWDGALSGTQYTVQYASGRGLIVCNLFQRFQEQ